MSPAYFSRRLTSRTAVLMKAASFLKCLPPMRYFDGGSAPLAPVFLLSSFLFPNMRAAYSPAESTPERRNRRPV